MMGGRSWDSWIDEYSESHRHPMNRLTHSIGIPLIAVSIILLPFGLFFHAMLWIALTLFIAGRILQFIGHYFEGKPPEFFKDYRFLFVGLRWWFKKIVGMK